MNVLSSRPRFTNAHTTNFYYAFVFLAPEKRRAIEAVYAFARRGDDAADAGLSGTEAAQQMALWHKDLESCYEDEGGRGLEHNVRPELGALAEAVKQFNIPKRHFEDLFLGFEMDLKRTSYATFNDLSLYCYRVASTIGLIAIEIFGYTNPRSRDYAVNLGTALQLVNILRDLESDARRGRVYLPEEDLEHFRVRRQDLLDGQPSDSLVELMQFEADRTRQYFNLARQALPPEDRRCMTPAEIMAAIYWRLLGDIQRRGYNVFGQRVRLSRALKFWTAFSVYLGAEWFSQPSSR
jgi:15-cis-phytoene synthase